MQDTIYLIKSSVLFLVAVEVLISIDYFGIPDQGLFMKQVFSLI